MNVEKSFQNFNSMLIYFANILIFGLKYKARFATYSF